MSQRVRELFHGAFGTLPAVVTCAPGRVEVLGNHTDYNEGLVLSGAIDRTVWAAVGRRATEPIALCSSRFGAGVVRARADEPTAAGLPAWIRYPLGVYRALRQRGHRIEPFALALHGDVPLGAGLSSSAAVTVSCATALAALAGLCLEPIELARCCQQAERELVGAHCGLLDPLTALCGQRGHLLLIDFRTETWSAVPFPADRISVAITTSGVARSLATSAYNERRAECARAAAWFARQAPGVRSLRDVSRPQLLDADGTLDAVALRRAAHVVGENERVRQAVRCLERHELDRFGALLWESHQSSQELFDNSGPELDALVDIARTAEGVLGARLTGGGFAGATLALLDRSSQAAYEQTIVAEYERRTGRRAEVCFATLADGARVVTA